MITRHYQRLFSLLMGGFLATQCVLPVWANRIAPELDIKTFSEEEEEQPFIGVDDIQPEGYAMMNVASPFYTDGFTPTLRGNVELKKSYGAEIVPGAFYELPKGEKLQLVIMDFIANGYSVEGDEFHARVKESVERDGRILIPRNALVKGHLKQSLGPGKAFSKRGQLTLEFDYILMPDGRKIPLSSGYKKGDNAAKAVGRGALVTVGSTIGGAVKGVLFGLRLGGLTGASLTNGATLIGGAGLGAIEGLGKGVSNSGNYVMFEEGDEISVALQKPLELPEVIVPPDTENEIDAPGLAVDIQDYQLTRDPFGTENQVNLVVHIDNQSEYYFGSFDVALMDEYDNRFHFSPFGQRNMMFLKLAPNQRLDGVMTFSVQNPQARHYLVFFDPRTRQIVERVSLTEALKKLSHKSEETKSKKRKKRRSSRHRRS